MKRRRVLALTGLGLSAAVAGCGIDDSDDAGDDTGTGADDTGDDGADDGTGNGTDEEALEDDEGNTPIVVLEPFFEALAELDIDRLHEIIHSEQSAEPEPEHFGDVGWELLDVSPVSLVDAEPDVAAMDTDAPPDDERAIHVRATAEVEDEEVGQTTIEEEFIVVTEDGRWKLWDFYGGLFHEPIEIVEITSVRGEIGAESEIHEVGVRITPAEESDRVDVSGLIFSEFFAFDADGDHKFLATARINQPEDGEATIDTDPADIEPGFEAEGIEHEDFFGVSVVSAESENDLRMEHGDEYELQVETTGEETDDGAISLLPLVPGDQLRIELIAEFGGFVGKTVDIPDLDEYDVGDVVELLEE